MAPAPIACTSTLFWARTTPAMAPATATGLLVAETLRTSIAGAAPSGPGKVLRDAEDVIIVPAKPVRHHRPRPRRSRRYLAYSTQRVSRSTTTLTRPA